MRAGYRDFLAAVLVLLGTVFSGLPAIAASYEEGLRAFDGNDYSLAYEIWKPLGEAGDALAQYSLGKLFEAGGDTIQQDFGEAKFWYGKAAEQGVPAAQNNLALMHAQGRGMQRSVERAIELWYVAAKNNHPMAQYNLGLAYLRGEGLVKDEREAAAWFRRSADSGLPEAQFAVGQMNRLGLVLSKDAAQALTWYKKAADQGHKDADVQVQILQANGVTPGEVGPPTVTPQALKTPAAVAAANAKAKLEAQARAKAMAEAKQEAEAAAAATAATTGSEAQAEGTDDQSAPAPAAEQAPVAENAGQPAVAPDPVDPDGPAFTAAQSVAVQTGDSEAPAKTAPSTAASVAEPAVPKVEPEPMQAKAETPKAGEDEPAQTEAPRITLAEAEAPAATGATEPGSEAAADAPGRVDDQGQAPQTATATATAAAPSTSTPAGATVKVWIASAKSEDEGLKFWQETQGKHPDLFSGKQGEVAKVDYGQGATFFRLLAGPVSSREAALNLCKQLRAREPGAFCKIQKN